MAAMFGKLARMQLEKAAASATTRGLRDEEEINLYYQVVGKDAYVKALADKSSPISVFSQFDKGRKHLLLGSLQTLEAAADWESVYTVCQYALNKQDEAGKPSFLAFDMRVWKLFIKAATMRADVEG